MVAPAREGMRARTHAQVSYGGRAYVRACACRKGTTRAAAVGVNAMAASRPAHGCSAPMAVAFSPELSEHSRASPTSSGTRRFAMPMWSRWSSPTSCARAPLPRELACARVRVCACVRGRVPRTDLHGRVERPFDELVHDAVDKDLARGVAAALGCGATHVSIACAQRGRGRVCHPGADV